MPLKAIWENSTPYSRFLLTVGVVLISAVLFTVISVMAAIAIYGVGLVQLQQL
jgi:hypothetical protein